jgi:hypothetical protein
MSISRIPRKVRDPPRSKTSNTLGGRDDLKEVYDICVLRDANQSLLPTFSTIFFAGCRKFVDDC